MLSPARGTQKWVLIDATAESVFDYLADLNRHGEWDAQTGFRVVRVSEEPFGEGSFCERLRLETFQAPILRGGATTSQVSWMKRLVVTGWVNNQALDFETTNLYNGLSIGSETVSFRLLPEGAGSRLVMTSKKNAKMPGPFHIVMLATDLIQGPASRLVSGWLVRVFPRLRSNAELSRIKAQVERM